MWNTEHIGSLVCSARPLVFDINPEPWPLAQSLKVQSLATPYPTVDQREGRNPQYQPRAERDHGFELLGSVKIHQSPEPSYVPFCDSQSSHSGILHTASQTYCAALLPPTEHAKFPGICIPVPVTLMLCVRQRCRWATESTSRYSERTGKEWMLTRKEDKCIFSFKDMHI